MILRFNDNDIPFNMEFKLFMVTKLQNPTFLPDVTIKTNIINFIVTESGLEDQLLSEVVKLELPELEQ